MPIFEIWFTGLNENILLAYLVNLAYLMAYNNYLIKWLMHSFGWPEQAQLIIFYTSHTIENKRTFSKE